MAYTYRFKDKYDNTIYVGYTGQTMAQRMNQHFNKGHLPKECYREVAKIECIKWATKSDAQIMEVYYINKYKPKYFIHGHVHRNYGRNIPQKSSYQDTTVINACGRCVIEFE